MSTWPGKQHQELTTDEVGNRCVCPKTSPAHPLGSCGEAGSLLLLSASWTGIESKELAICVTTIHDTRGHPDNYNVIQSICGLQWWHSPGAAAPTPHSSLEETLNCTQKLMKTKIQFSHPSEWDCQNSTPNPRSQTPLQLARLQLYYCTLLCEATSWFPGFHIVFRTPYQGGGAALQGPLGWSYHLLKPGVSDLGLAPPQWYMWNLKKGSFQATVDACPVPGGCMIMSLQVTQSKEAWGAA